MPGRGPSWCRGPRRWQDSGQEQQGAPHPVGVVESGGSGPAQVSAFPFWTSAPQTTRPSWF